MRRSARIAKCISRPQRTISSGSSARCAVEHADVAAGEKRRPLAAQHHRAHRRVRSAPARPPRGTGSSSPPSIAFMTCGRLNDERRDAPPRPAAAPTGSCGVFLRPCSASQHRILQRADACRLRQRHCAPRSCGKSSTMMQARRSCVEARATARPPARDDHARVQRRLQSRLGGEAVHDAGLRGAADLRFDRVGRRRPARSASSRRPTGSSSCLRTKMPPVRRSRAGEASSMQPGDAVPETIAGRRVSCGQAGTRSAAAPSAAEPHREVLEQAEERLLRCGARSRPAPTARTADRSAGAPSSW